MRKPHLIASPRLMGLLIVLILALTVPAIAQDQDNEPLLDPDAPRFEVADDLTIAALRKLDIEGSDVLIEEVLEDGDNYSRYIASYESEGNTIYGLLTIPHGDVPEDGFKAIVFNHGYIPPKLYRTTERYVDYVDQLARNGFVVFKIDMRGHGRSEGDAIGSYFSPGYTIDAISALRSLQNMDIIDPDGIGMWGHSMAGNLVLRAMLIEPDVQAGVIWAGAVYSYDDFMTYSISDTSFVRDEESPGARRSSAIFETYGRPDTSVPFWKAVSLTEHIAFLDAPVQLHHALDDTVVDVGYARDLVRVLDANEQAYELHEYAAGGHNIGAPSFDEAMARTIAFFKANL